MDYTDYTIEDLASEDSFVQWVNGSDAEAGKFWDDFIVKHPEMSVRVFQARTLVLNLRQAGMRDHSDQQVDSLWQGIDARIRRESELELAHKRRRRSHLHAWAALTGLIIISVATWYTAIQSRNFINNSDSNAALLMPDYIEEVNTSENILRVHLSDGTAVALENNSRLKYRKSFAGERFRTVYLTGEAFFEVAKDPHQPFLVYTDEVVTRVLGTSFRIKGYEDNEEVVVSVKTGKVSVYAVNDASDDSTSQKNATVLLPNQQVTYMRDHASFEKALIPEPEILLKTVTKTDFTFENTPVKEAFNVLQTAYGIEIIFDEEVMSNCFITAPLGSEPLFEKLRVICRTIGARYEMIDAKIVITSTGC